MKLHFCSPKWLSIDHFIWFNLMIRSRGIIRFCFKFLARILHGGENFMFHYLRCNTIVDFFLPVMWSSDCGLRYHQCDPVIMKFLIRFSPNGFRVIKEHCSIHCFLTSCKVVLHSQHMEDPRVGVVIISNFLKSNYF